MKRDHIHTPASAGDAIADGVCRLMGSWRFIIAQTVIVAGWVALNLAAVLAHWDPYPFILLNLLFSTQAAYAAPVIMMAQNRQAAKDRDRDDLEAAEVAQMLEMQRDQMNLLLLQHKQMELLQAIRRAL